VAAVIATVLPHKPKNKPSIAKSFP
jgi:hypothetical protein